MSNVDPKAIKLSKIANSFARQNSPVRFTLVYYLLEYEYRITPEIKTEEHYLIANAANKFWNLVSE